MCVTDGAQSQRFPVECNSLIQVFVVALLVKAGGESVRKIKHPFEIPVLRSEIAEQWQEELGNCSVRMISET